MNNAHTTTELHIINFFFFQKPYLLNNQSKHIINIVSSNRKRNLKMRWGAEVHKIYPEINRKNKLKCAVKITNKNIKIFGVTDSV